MLTADIPMSFNGFFMFHSSSPSERALKIAGTFLAATFLMVGASVIGARDVLESDSQALRLVGDPCRDAVALPDRVTITWTTSRDADENHVMAGLTRSYGRVASATNARTHAATVTGFPEGATVHFRVQSRVSTSGATVQSGDCTITIPGIDRTAPITEATDVAPSTDSAEVTVIVNEPALAALTVLHADGTPALDIRIAGPTDPSTTIRSTIFGLTPTTDYRIRIDLTDAAGNSSTLTPDIALRTLRTE